MPPALTCGVFQMRTLAVTSPLFTRARSFFANSTWLPQGEPSKLLPSFHLTCYTAMGIACKRSAVNEILSQEGCIGHVAGHRHFALRRKRREYHLHYNLQEAARCRSLPI